MNFPNVLENPKQAISLAHSLQQNEKGRLRLDGALTSAENDGQAILLWLNRCLERPHTYRAYRREIERFLLWATLEAQCAFSDMSVESILAYLRFVQAPPSDWCSGGTYRRSDPRWRPFKAPLDESSQRQLVRILMACFNFLVKAGYIKGNPVALLPRHYLVNLNTALSEKVERYLPQSAWQVLWRYMETSDPMLDTEHVASSQAFKRSQAHYERIRFVISILYLQAPRLHELANAKMDDLLYLRERYWWRIKGKGSKVARIPMHPDALDAVKRYRIYLGLSPLPLGPEKGGWVRHLKGGQALSSTQLHHVVKLFLHQVAQHCQTSDPESARHFNLASTHWFRHTALTHQAQAGVDLQHLRAFARHATLETTRRYLHEEDEQWHETLRQKHGLRKTHD